MKINNLEQAIDLMKTYILITTDSDKGTFLFTLKNDAILMINDFVNTTISKEDFKELFLNSNLAIYKKIEDNEEIDQEHITYRQ